MTTPSNKDETEVIPDQAEVSIIEVQHRPHGEAFTNMHLSRKKKRTGDDRLERPKRNYFGVMIATLVTLSVATLTAGISASVGYLNGVAEGTEKTESEFLSKMALEDNSIQGLGGFTGNQILALPRIEDIDLSAEYSIKSIADKIGSEIGVKFAQTSEQTASPVSSGIDGESQPLVSHITSGSWYAEVSTLTTEQISMIADIINQSVEPMGFAPFAGEYTEESDYIVIANSLSQINVGSPIVGYSVIIGKTPEGLMIDITFSSYPHIGKSEEASFVEAVTALYSR